MIEYLAGVGLTGALALAGLSLLGLRERLGRLEALVAELQARPEVAVDDSLRALLDELELAGERVSERAASALERARVALQRLEETSEGDQGGRSIRGQAGGSSEWAGRSPRPVPGPMDEDIGARLDDLMRVRALAARGQTPAEIARSTGRSRGEVEMALRLPGRAEPATLSQSARQVPAATGLPGADRPLAPSTKRGEPR